MKNSMEKMIDKIKQLKKHKANATGERHLHYAKKLEAQTTIFERLYGYELKEKMLDIYDEYCSDDQVENIIDYIALDSNKTSKIMVYAYDFPGVHSEITIKTSPLRIELTGVKQEFTEVLWAAA